MQNSQKKKVTHLILSSNLENIRLQEPPKLVHFLSSALPLYNTTMILNVK